MRCEKIYREGAKDRLKEIIEQREWRLKDTIAEAIVQGKTQNNLNSNKKAIRDEMKVRILNKMNILLIFMFETYVIIFFLSYYKMIGRFSN